VVKTTNPFAKSSKTCVTAVGARRRIFATHRQSAENIWRATTHFGRRVELKQRICSAREATRLRPRRERHEEHRARDAEHGELLATEVHRSQLVLDPVVVRLQAQRPTAGGPRS